MENCYYKLESRCHYRAVTRIKRSHAYQQFGSSTVSQTESRASPSCSIEGTLEVFSPVVNPILVYPLRSQEFGGLYHWDNSSSFRTSCRPRFACGFGRVHVPSSDSSSAHRLTCHPCNVQRACIILWDNVSALRSAQSNLPRPSHHLHTNASDVMLHLKKKQRRVSSYITL